jgi:hypothetical protein
VRNSCALPGDRDGADLLSRFTDAELAMMRDFLVEATELVDRHGARLRTSAE